MNFFKDIYENYISVNLKDYPNINIDLEINKLLFFVVIGLCVSCFVISHYQSCISLLIKKLLRAEAFSEEKSKTLSELGLADNRSVKLLISKNAGSLKKLICVNGRKVLTYEEYIESEKEKKRIKKLPKEERRKLEADLNLKNEIDFTSAEIYIPEAMKAHAEHTFKNNNGSFVKTLLYCVIIFVFYLIVMFSMPLLLEAINSILS